MTINELEQGIRNLIATQPMITTGPSGEVVNGVLSLIDAFRNMNFKLQTYPSQDVLKFNMTSEVQKLEANFTNMVCQVLSERGINVMLYIPRTQTFGPMVNQFGVMAGAPDPSMMMGQMMYNASVLPQSQMMQMPQPQVAPMGAYNPMQPQMQGVGVQYPPRQQRAHAPTFPGYESPKQATRPVPPTATEGQKVRTAPQSKVKASPKANPINEVIKTTKGAPVEEPAPSAEPSAAEMLMGAFDTDVGASKGKASGRDYLMELLKK